ncbi:MAG: hypothetical protein AAGJ82_13705, partial [Bacteroidota bacterium]
MSTKFTILFLLLSSFSLSAQVYVNQTATGSNDGTSWTDAYTDLSAALSATSTGDEVWVAAGTYLPGDNRNDFFRFPHDLQVYGGFNGTESALEDRDVNANTTILSGDLNGDDVQGNFTTNRTDNARHV